MNKKFIVIFIVLLIVTNISLVVFSLYSKNENIQESVRTVLYESSLADFFEKKEIHLTDPVEIQNEKEGAISLYKKQILAKDGSTKNIFLTLDSSEYQGGDIEKKFGLQKLHTHDFWDPKKCSQMITLMGGDVILFSDSFIEVYGEKDFRTYLFVYDKNLGILTSMQLGIPIQKMFYDGEKYFALSKNKTDNLWKLYQIDIENKKLVLEKKYTKQVTLNDFGINMDKDALELITATDSLLWCDAFNKKCAEENAFNFLPKDINFVIEKSTTNPFEIKLLYDSGKILEFKKDDLLRSFILGLN